MLRDAAPFKNGGGAVVMWWAQSAPLVGIGLTDLSKFEFIGQIDLRWSELLSYKTKQLL